MKAAVKVCKKLNIINFLSFEGLLKCWPSFEANFYRVPTRRIGRNKNAEYTIKEVEEIIRTQIRFAVQEFNPDYIMTHNYVGEYGHGDHRLLFQLVMTQDEIKNVLMTDIVLENKSHISEDRIPYIMRLLMDKQVYIKNYEIIDDKLDEYYESLDSEFFKAIKSIYVNENSWSWNNPIIKRAKLYLIEK